MKVPVSWLKDFVNINIDVKELADKLVSCGFEIEEIINLKDKIKGVVSGKILSISKHPDADKLSVCEIDIATKKITVVSAATNIKEGDIIPVALDGAELPTGKTIKAGELRGVMSDGMMCSGAELDLTEEDFAGAGIYGILILSNNTPLGKDINEIIGNDDVVLDVAITSNRQDCNSIIGIAREIAVVTGQKMKMPVLTFNEADEDVNSYLDVENKNYDLCARYMAKVVKDIKIEQSPKLIKDRLRAMGIRPINNIVDITNYVLIETGQPMHAFDLNLLEGSKIVVRNAVDGEKIVALDGKEYTLNQDNLLICDINKPIAIAGVMGGEYSAVNQNTNIIALESASFAKDSVRHTSRRLNLRSDSSQRFEKGIDLASQELGLCRALSLIDQYGWGKIVSGQKDCRKASLDKKVISCNYNDINKILGIHVDKQIITDILNSLEIDTVLEGETVTATIPLFRDDIVGVNDLAEEVIRIYGYDNITPTLLKDSQMVRGGKTLKQKLSDRIKDILVSHGLFEIVSYSFVSPKAYDMLHVAKDDNLRKAVKLKNPLGEDFSVMRTTLAYSMLKTMAYNLARGNKSGRLFEYAKTYIPKSLPLTELPKEEYYISLGFFGDDEDFYSIKGVIEDILDYLGIKRTYVRSNKAYLHPGRAAEIVADGGAVIGYVGEVLDDVATEFDTDKRLYVAEISVNYMVDNAVTYHDFKPYSKYQGMERDLALIMPKETEVAKVLEIINSKGTQLLENIQVFDVYEGNQIPKGQKSVAINLQFRHLSRTLKEEEINLIIDDILLSLKEINAAIR